MKKHILLTLAAAGLFLAACGEQPAQSSSPTPTPSSESSVTPTSSSDSSAASSDSSAASSDSSAASSDSSSSVEPVVINAVEVVIADGSATCHIGDVLLVQAKVNGATSTAVTWSSSDPEKATVTAAGAVTIKALGKVKIIATSTVDTTKKGEVELDVVETAPTPIKDVKKDKTVKVLAKVTALCKQEYAIIDDGTGAAAIYFGSKGEIPSEFVIGKVIQVEGKATEYYGQIQFYASGDGAATITWPTDKTVQSTTIENPTAITKDTIADYLPDGSKAIKNAVAVSFLAPAVQSGSYANWKLGNYLVSYKSKHSSLPSLTVGHNYQVKGYLSSYNSTSSYFPLIGVSVEDKGEVELTDIAFAAESADIDLHEFKKLEPVAVPDGAPIGQLEWNSSAEAVATVDANGVVHGLTHGTAVITATVKGSDPAISANITVNVSDQEVVEEYTALKDLAKNTAYKVRGRITAKTKEYVYIDDGTDVAAIKASGDEYVIGKEMVIDGTTSFYFGEKQFADGAVATVREDKKITGITLDKPLTLTPENIVDQKNKGEISSQAVTFTAEAVQADSHANWKIGDLLLSYANKPDSMPTLVAGGKYTVTGYVRSYNTKNSYFGVVAVSVERVYDTLQSIAITQGSEVSVGVGEKKTLTATPTPATADGSVTWASADPEKVTVNATSGEIEGIAETTSPVTITATSVADKTKTATCQVTVTAQPAPVEYTKINTLADKTAYAAPGVRGRITAKTNEYVYFDDGTGVAAVKASGSKYVIGDEIVVTGTTKFYFGEVQFNTSPAPTIAIQEDKIIEHVTTENPTALTSAVLAEWAAAGEYSSKPVTFTTTAVKRSDKDYAEWKIGDYHLSYASKPAGMPNLIEGATYEVTGYIRSYNKKSAYFGIVAIDVQQQYDTLESIAVTEGASVYVNINESKGLTITPNPITADGRVTWASADPSKVTVDPNTGVITGVAATDAPVNVTATSTADPTKTAICAVTVNNVQVLTKTISMSDAGITWPTAYAETTPATPITTTDGLVFNAINIKEDSSEGILLKSGAGVLWNTAALPGAITKIDITFSTASAAGFTKIWVTSGTTAFTADKESGIVANVTGCGKGVTVTYTPTGTSDTYFQIANLDGSSNGRFASITVYYLAA